MNENPATTIEAPPADPTNDYRVARPPPCRHCGGAAHGPVGELIRCLENRIAILEHDRATLILERMKAKVSAIMAPDCCRLEPTPHNVHGRQGKVSP
jgi:hypothetical protein